MDIEKICASLRVLPTTEELLTAEKALYALQAENEKLRTELEKEAAARKKQADILCELRGQKYEQMSVIDRLRSELNDLRAQWDMYGGDVGITATFSELEKVKRERDAAQVTLAETSGLAGGVVQTLFGVPLERMRELAKAELEGRIVLRSAGAGKKCGSCGNFHRIPGTKWGTCAIRQWERNRLGQTEHWRHSFTPSQSYGACRDYIPREDDNHG